MSKKKKRLVIFDLDGTLTKSKSPVEPRMSKALRWLIDKPTRRVNRLGHKGTYVGVISGGAYHQFQNQFLKHLNDGWHDSHRGYLYLLPCSGGQMYECTDLGYEQVYNNDLTLRQKHRIYDVFLAAAHFPEMSTGHGEIAEDRGSQVTFSMCGQKAPLELKEQYDPDGKKRDIICRNMRPLLSPSFEVRFGGTTSIDVTKAGIDKEFGIRKLIEHLNTSFNEELEFSDILFVGDRLEEGGNDYPAKRMGLNCKEVSGPEDTIKIIEEILNVKI